MENAVYLPPRDNTTSPLGPAELRFALKASRVGSWALDLDTNELTTSEACKLNFGRDVNLPFTYAELLAAVHPGDQRRMREAVERSVRSGEEYEIEYRVVTPRGEIRWAHIRAQTSFRANGRPQALFGVSMDVTAHRRAELELREAADRLALVTEFADVGLWDLADGKLILPARTKAMLGLSPDADLSVQDCLTALLPEDLEPATAAYQAATDPARRALFSVDCRILLDATFRRVALHGRGIFDETDRCVRLMGVARYGSVTDEP